MSVDRDVRVAEVLRALELLHVQGSAVAWDVLLAAGGADLTGDQARQVLIAAAADGQPVPHEPGG